MNIGIVIQARMGSSRFPGKILETIDNQEMLRYVIERLKKTNLPIIVATTVSEKDDVLVAFLEKNNINYIRGSESNVLERYIDAATKYDLDIVCRICSDSPFVDPELLLNLHKEVLKTPHHDYWSYLLNNKPTVLSHIGVFGEFARVAALRQINSNINTPSLYKEHVTNGLYNQPEVFRLYFKNIDNVFKKFDEIRLTVDTPQDLENINYIVKHNEGLINKSAYEVCEIVNNNEDLKNIMTHLISQNKK